MKIILDCDTGIDDAIAIAYALAHPDAEVLGIGTVHGNIESDVAAENTLKLLEVAGRGDIAVAVGAGKPLLRPVSFAKFVHGEDGLGNTNLPPTGLKPTGEHAVDQIIRLARQYPAEVTLIPVGPLTNIALALMKEPELPDLVREVVLMGGTVVQPGNVTPAAEANIWHDPEAARLVFEAPWPVRMCGLDATVSALLRDEHRERWEQSGSPVAQWLGRVVAFYFDFYSQSLGFRACVMHDAVAVGLALGTLNVAEAHNLPVEVVTHDGPALGQTLADRRSLVSRTQPVEGAHTEVLLRVDGAAFIEELVDRIAEYRSA